MSTAALVAGWGKSQRRGFALPVAVPGPLNPAGNPYTGDANGGPIGLTVELYLGALGWTDISTYVYYRDRVRITRGRPNEASRVQPQTCSMTLNNADGRFSPRNPNGPWYGIIGRNTPLRVSRMQNGVRRYRFTGEVPSWPVTWDISGRDVYVPIQAAGMLRRLQQGTQTLGSAMFRAYALREAGSLNPIAYWSCEEGTTATSFASGIGGGAMNFSGSPQLASNSSFVCSKPLPVTNSSIWRGAIPAHPTGPDNVLRFLMLIPSSGETDGIVIASLSTQGTVKRVDLINRTAGGLQLKGYDALGNTLFDTGPVAFGTFGTLFRVSFALRTSGSNVGYEIQTMTPTGTVAVTSGTLSTASIGNATQIQLNPAGGLTSTTLGHVSYQSTWDTLFDLVSQINAWNGEGPVDRYTRLMGEQGINIGNFSPDFSLINGNNSVALGYQLDDTLMNLVQQIADADLCLIYEGRDQASLVRRSRISLYNQGTKYQPSLTSLTLDYAQHEFSGPLNPLDDDAYTRNDITAQRISGSMAQATDASALDRLSTVNVGDYSTTYSLSLGGDEQLPDAAHWRLHVGTTDEPRYPTIPLNLRHSTFTGSVSLLNQALTMDIGDVVVINNPPAGRGAPDQIRLLLQGYSETLGIFEHDMVLNCSPESPYRVGMFDDPVLGRYDTDGSTLAAPLGPPLNPNPFFTGGSFTGWTPSNCAATVVGTSGSANPLPSGGPTDYGALIVPDGSTGHTSITNSGAMFPATPSTAYQVSCLVYSPAGFSAGLLIGITSYDASQVIISSSTASTAAVAAGTWTAFSESVTSAAASAFISVRVGHNGTPGVSDTLYVVSPVCWQGVMSVASTNTLLPAWTTSAGAFPFDIACGGERMTVTTITGASSPQTFTVARAVNGVAKAQTTGTDVRLWQPTVVSL